LTTLAAELKWRNGFSLAAAFEGEFSSTTTSYAARAWWVFLVSSRLLLLAAQS